MNLPTPGDREAYTGYEPRWAVRRLLYERRAELPRVIAAAAVTEGYLPRRSRRPAGSGTPT
jgi:lysyl-tRNA synthetase class 2